MADFEAPPTHVGEPVADQLSVLAHMRSFVLRAVGFGRPNTSANLSLPAEESEASALAVIAEAAFEAPAEPPVRQERVIPPDSRARLDRLDELVRRAQGAYDGTALAIRDPEVIAAAVNVWMDTASPKGRRRAAASLITASGAALPDAPDGLSHYL